MKFAILIILISVACSLQAQLTSVTTDKISEASGNLTSFVVVDTETNYVMAKEPVKYNASNEMPTCYFTTIPGTESGLTYGSKYRLMLINANLGVDGEHWIINDNKAEGKVIFSRRRFITPKHQGIWVPKIEDDCVIFLNIKGVTNTNWGGYLTIDANGVFKTVKDYTQASRWKLISAN